MNRLAIHQLGILSVSAIAMLGLTLLAGNAVAQTARDLVGTWTWVSVDNISANGTRTQPFSANPKGILVFLDNGRFSYLLTRPGRPKYASNNRDQGTAAEDKATVQGSLAYSGTYSVSDKTLIFRVEATTYPNAEGTEQRRSIILIGDELKWTNPNPTVGGTAESVLRRLQ